MKKDDYSVIGTASHSACPSVSRLLLVTQTPLTFFDGGVHIWHNDCLWYVDDNEGFISPAVNLVLVRTVFSVYELIKIIFLKNGTVRTNKMNF